MPTNTDGDQEQQEAVCGTCGQPRSSSAHTSYGAAIDHRFIAAPVVPSDDHEHLHRHVDAGGFYIWHDHAHSHDAKAYHDEDDYEDSQHSHGDDPAHATHEVEARGHIHEPAAGVASPTPSQDAAVRFRCGGCGVWLREDEMISPHGGKRDGHVIPGSVPNYCGPVNEVIPPSQDAEGDLVLGAALAELAEAEEWADRLAYAIAPVSVIGEHSSANNPWMNALEIVGQRESAIRAPYEEQVKAVVKDQFRCTRCKGTTAPQCVSCDDYQYCRCRPGQGANAEKCWACVDGIDSRGQRFLAALESLGDRS